jgi:hypothetical protein
MLLKQEHGKKSIFAPYALIQFKCLTDYYNTLHEDDQFNIFKQTIFLLEAVCLYSLP